MSSENNLVKEYVKGKLFDGVVSNADSTDARIAFLTKVIELIIIKLYENRLLSKGDILGIFDTFKSK